VAGSEVDQLAVSCPITSFCEANTDDGYLYAYEKGGWVYQTSIAGGGPTGSQVDVSYATPKLCAAVDGAGDVLVYGGSSWSKPKSLGGSSGQLFSISCATAKFCMAVENADAFTYSVGATAAAS
jgi:hypothetical protein